MNRFFLPIIFFVFCVFCTATAQQECNYVHEKNEEIERFTEGYVRNFYNNARPRAVIKIPVVVHVIWRTAAGNISDAQIRGQIDSLTKDFRKKNVDAANIPSQKFRDLAADSEIEFCLANRDTLGYLSTGIVRKQTNLLNFGEQFDNFARRVYYSKLGGDDAWRPDRYFNVWVCEFSEGGILGYVPPLAKALAKPAEDGCLINVQAFGINANNLVGRNKGRTLVHEVGHYFNLLHIFGSDRTCNDDDEVEDTPRQAGQNTACPMFPAPVSCTSNGGDMFMNYMDYPYDECVLMFTKGQKARMWAALDGYRNGLTLRGAACDPFVATASVKEPLWTIAPNPATATFDIVLPDEWRYVPKVIQLVDVVGRVVLEKRQNRAGIAFDVQNVSSGLYIIKIKVENQIFVKKMNIVK
ncbi:MAG: M43 family zinc metalloprotease [Saprospiraceae bacterium]|nr:M43 family zinc metalloprotease [Saprospiraceae bacterium]